MRKFKTSLYGLDKQSVQQLLERLQLEHEQKKKAMKKELQDTLDEIQRLKQKLE